MNHPDELPPGSDEEIMFMNTENTVLKCPITTTEIVNPLRSKVCNHVFEKDAILRYLKFAQSGLNCPVAGMYIRA